MSAYSELLKELREKNKPARAAGSSYRDLVNSLQQEYPKGSAEAKKAETLRSATKVTDGSIKKNENKVKTNRGRSSGLSSKKATAAAEAQLKQDYAKREAQREELMSIDADSIEDNKTRDRVLASQLKVAQQKAKETGYQSNARAKVSTAKREQQAEAREKVTEINKDRTRIEKLTRYEDKSYDDTLPGQFGANYAVGRLTQDSSLAWSEYLDNPTEKNRKYAEALDATLQQFSTRNSEALDDENVKMSWVSKSLANYLPQFLDQTGYAVKGALVGAVAGTAAAPGVGTGRGIKAGIIVSSGVYSYKTMRGAAFKALLESGVDEATAREAASDEAFVSSLIEMADTGIDMMTLGGTALLNALSKGGWKGIGKLVTEWAGQDTAKRFALIAANYGLNVGSEAMEEATQEAVSIANQARAKSGKNSGSLVADATSVFVSALTGKNKEAADQIRQAAAEGAKIAIMMGGADLVTTQATTKVVSTAQAELAGAGIRAAGNEMNLLAHAKTDYAKETGTYKLAKSLESKLKSTGRVTLTDLETGRLFEQMTRDDAAAQVKVEKEAKAAEKKATKQPTAETKIDAQTEADLTEMTVSVDQAKAEYAAAQLSNPEVTVVSPVAQKLMTAGVKNDVAVEQAALIQKMQAGHPLTEAETQKLNVTDPAVRAVIEAETGVAVTGTSKSDKRKLAKSIIKSAAEVKAQEARTQQAVAEQQAGQVLVDQARAAAQAAADAVAPATEVVPADAVVTPEEKPAVGDSGAPMNVPAGSIQYADGTTQTFEQFAKAYEKRHPSAKASTVVKKFHEYQLQNQMGQPIPGSAKKQSKAKTAASKEKKAEADKASIGAAEEAPSAVRFFAGKQMSEEATAEAVRLEQESLKKFGKVVGVNVEFQKFEGADKDANGYYLKETNTVVLNSGKLNGLRHTTRIFLHEITHSAQDADRSLTKDILDMVKETRGAEHLNRLIKNTKDAYVAFYRQNNYSLGDLDVASEVAADYMMNIFASREALDRVAGMKPSLMGKLLRRLGVIREADGLSKSSRAHLDKLAGRMVEAQQKAKEQKSTAQEDSAGKQYSAAFEEAKVNEDVLALINKVLSGEFEQNEKLYFGTVDESVAEEIQNLVGVDVRGFKIAIEARQIDHILKDHGAHGKTDRSMADPEIIAKLEFVLRRPDEMRKAGKTSAYSYIRGGRNRTADTVLYERYVGEKSYYVVQAVPDTKAKTLYVVTAFIGPKGYKKEAPQLTNAQGPGATSGIESAGTSALTVADSWADVKKDFSVDYSVDTTGLSEADQAEANAILGRLKNQARFAKYGTSAYGAYTAERMDREIRNSSSSTVVDYAKSYIAWVEPVDFIHATTTNADGRAQLKKEAGTLDTEKLRNETQPIHLTVDFEDGRIVGHEGRHRMLALQDAGVDRVAVIVDAWNDDRHHTKPIGIMRLRGQNFFNIGRGVGFYLHDMLPLSKRYADVAKEYFAGETKRGVKFSIDAQTDADYLDAVKRGDMETAQRMVDEVADKAMPDSILREGRAIDKGEDAEGTLVKMYHGSGAKNFYTFEVHGGMLGEGIYLTSNWEEAVEYAAEKLGVEEGEYFTYVWDGEEFNSLGDLGETLESEGYVRAFYANVTDPDDVAKSAVYWEDRIALVRDKNQLKSADPVTYDDNGSVIPLSERFNEKNDDIRYSVNSIGEALTDGEVLTQGMTVTEDGKRYSIRSMRHDIAEGKMFKDLMKHCSWTQEDVDEMQGKLEHLLDIMEPHRDILDLNETFGRDEREFSPYKANSDPLYKISMDFSTLCSKRLLTQYVIENLQLQENRPMSAEEQMAIRDLLIEYGKQEKALQVACTMCYVEAARLKAPEQMNRWLADPEYFIRDYFGKKNKAYKAQVKRAQEDFKESKGYDRNAAKKQMSNADVTALNLIGPEMYAKYKPSEREQQIIERAKKLPASTYLTADNLARLSENDPEIYDAYVTCIRDATRSKALETAVPYYYGDSKRKVGKKGKVVSDKFIAAVNRENGMRFSSWSDWRIQHLLDFITAVIENSVRGAAMHGYTKYCDEVRVLGKTGMMFNMSGVPAGNTGLDENGNLLFSETDSVDIEDAKQARNEFPETSGVQCIGVSDDHIRKLLQSDFIDYVIPYHVSGMNADLRRMGGIFKWKDYQGVQHAKAFRDDAGKEPTFSEFFVGYDTGVSGIEAMKASAERYKRLCKERGLTPKFNDFAGEENYWKLLVDRKMINQVTGQLIEQKPVKADFDFDLIEQIVQKYVDNFDNGLEAKALAYVKKNWDSIPARIETLKKHTPVERAAKTLANGPMAAQPKQYSLNPDTGYEAGSIQDRVLTLLQSGSWEDAMAQLQNLVDEFNEKDEDEISADEKAFRDVLMGRKPVAEEEKVKNRQRLDDLAEEFGAHHPGEKAVRPVIIPKQVGVNTGAAQHVRTILESEHTPEWFVAEAERLVAENAVGYTYEIATDKAAMQHVENKQGRGFERNLTEWEDKFNGGERITKNDIALGEFLYTEAVKAGDIATATRLVAELAAAGTRAGQTVQAMSLLKKMTPSGQLYYLQKAVENLNKDLERQGKAPTVEIDPDLAADLLDAETTEEMKAAMEAILQDIANQAPVTLMDKWNTWRYLAMLGNPRTHFRNVASNVVFAPAVFLKDLIAVTAQTASGDRISADERTKNLRELANSFLYGLSGGKVVGSSYTAFADADFDNVAEVLRGGGKQNPADLIRDLRPIFKGKATKWINTASKVNSQWMENEDGVFLKWHYVRALSQYLAAQNADLDNLMNTAEGRNQLVAAREWAVQEAQKATFRDASAFASALSRFEKSSKAAGVLVGGLLPFKKTPVNILKRGMEYSPVGLVKTVLDGLRNKTTATKFIDGLAAGLTGTGIMAMGLYLAAQGLLRGSGSDDDKENEFEELQGAQKYSLVLGDGTNFTIDWMAPSALPLFVGAEWYKVRSGEGEFTAADLANAMSLLAEPMFNLSMLDGLNNTLKSAGYSDSPLTAVGTSLLTSYVGQAVPTLLGQITRTMDGTRRTTYIDKNKNTVEWLDRAAQYNLTKIPGASSSLTPKLDAWGRTDDQKSFLLGALENFLSPGYVNSKNTSPMEEELERLYKATGESSVLPKSAPKYFSVGGQRYDLSSDEWVEVQTLMGQGAYAMLTNLVNAKAFQILSDAEKVDVIDDVYTFVREYAKTKVIPDYVSNTKWIRNAIASADKGQSVETIILNRDR